MRGRAGPTVASCALAIAIGAGGVQAADLQPLERQAATEAQPLPRAPAPEPGAAQPLERQQARTASPPAGGDEMLFNFQDADIKGVIKTVSQLTGMNFIIDPRVKGKVSIISAKPISKSAAYDIFLTALKAQGFTAADVRPGVVKIIPVGEGKQSASVEERDAKRRGELMVSQVVIVQHGTATEMVPLLRPLMAPTSQLSAYSPANSLIITDYADNVRRLLDLIEQIDKPVSTDVTVIPLHNASALDMASLVEQLMETGGGGRPIPGKPAVVGGGSRTTIVPDLRTNSLLIRSDNPGRVAQLRRLIATLDVPAKTEGNTRVIYLRNADATKLVDVLRGLLEAETRAAATARQPAGRAAAAPAAATGAQTSLIQADEATNSLIINAPDSVYNNLRGVIEKLDTRRAQVFVEALIVEITADRAAQLGIQWATGSGVGKEGAAAGFTNFTVPGGSSLGGAVTAGAGGDPSYGLSSAAGLTLAFLGNEFELSDGTRVRGLGGLIRALEGDSLANILSTPNLLTLDNTEAKIVVGQNVPFITGSFTQTTTGATNPFQTIERKDVGLTLQIKPQITEGGSVKLEIQTEVSSVTQDSTAADIITNTRTLQTTVNVENGHTIVLGGLIKDDATQNTQGVPLLSRIPLLGWLFKYRTKSKVKTNLMVFLKPTIVRDVADSAKFTTDRYGYILGEQHKMRFMGVDESMLDEFSPARNRPITPTPSLEQPSPDRAPGAAHGAVLGPPEAGAAIDTGITETPSPSTP